jgi:hypothetical protein
LTNRSRRIGFGPGCQRVMRAMLEMRKLDIAGLERAAEAA